VGTSPPHGEHDWWTPQHPEDGLSWEDPATIRPAPRRVGRATGARRLRRRARSAQPARAGPKPWAGRRARRGAAVRRHRVALAGAIGGVLVLVVAAVLLLRGGPANVVGPPLPGLGHPAASGDPFRYVPGRQAQFAERAAIGNAQVLFTKSPGGVLATAARVASFRTQVDAAVKGTAIPARVLEGMVFVESAGRPDVIAGNDPANASGLTQILAQTGQSLLRMHIDLAASRRLTGAITAAASPAAAARLTARRAAIDDRFDPPKALAATIRYLQIAERHFGRVDLAVESYHMGIGNLQQVLGDYDGGGSVPYAQLYFGTSPTDRPAAYNLLSSFSDDSELYYWRVLGAAMIMRLYRTDRAALARLARLEVAFPSNAIVLVPPHRIAQFGTPADLSAAYQRRSLLPLPRNAAALGLAYASTMGSLASRLRVPRTLYKGLRPAALDLLIELVSRIRALSGNRAPMTVASTVTDGRYDSLLGASDPPAQTGYTFQLQRRYRTPAVAVAFQAMLDRLQSLNVIAWLRGSATIEITVSPDADRVIAHGV
jgi:hypothetical protein